MDEIKVTKIDVLPNLKRVKKVAAYARVSCEKDAMLHSLSAQVSYYNNLIQNNEEWLFAGIYADEGISGTKTDRPEFNRMIEDARKGKIDLIITKSISRFARNTTVLLETVRELKKLDIDVFFEEQNIHTLSAEGELMLTLMASLAQEEARSMSENVRWRNKKDMEEGILCGGNSCFGYKLVNKQFILVPEEAEIVKLIFDLYLQGNGIVKIAKFLNEKNIKSYKGNLWGKTSVQRLLTNYNYTGDLILQKTYVVDFISKKKKRNKGERNKYLVENNHEPIISHETFNKVQELMKERMPKTKRVSIEKTNPYSGILKCGCCGKSYKHRNSQYRSFYLCSTYDNYGRDYCSSKQIRDDVLEKSTCQALGIESFDETLVKQKIKTIEVQNNNLLIFNFIDGTTKEIIYNDPSRKDSWTPEMKQQAAERAKKQIHTRGADGKWQK